MSLEAQLISVGLTPVSELAPAPPEVAALTRRMVAGEETAYRTFHETYVPRLSRYLLVVAAGDEDAALEALQAALVRVVRHIKVFSDEAVFWSWLTVLARTAFADQKRKRRRYLAFLDRFMGYARVQTSANEPEADRALLGLLDRHVALLPSDEHQLLAAKYSEKRSVREIAAELDLTEKAVESRLGRIRTKLKTAILEELKRE